MGRVNLKINGQEIRTWQGATILETALENEIFIPHLCYHPDLKPQGACRVCLIELDNGQIAASCRTKVKEGMVVETKSPEVDRVVRPVIEMIIANNHMDCRNCLKKGQCQLQRIMAHMKIDKHKIQQNMRLPATEMPLDDSNPFFIRDPNKCVLCGICVRTCQEIAKINAIDFAGRGNKTKIAAFGDKSIAGSKCVSCGECVIRCPVGALVLRTPRRPAKQFKSVCPYCGVGCGIYLGIKDNEIVQVKGDTSSPVNSGNLCVKGRFGMSFVHSPERLKEPMVRINRTGLPTAGVNRSAISGQRAPHLELFRKAPWEEAFDLVAKNFKKYRGEEFAIIASTKCTNEDNYVAQKFARVVMRSNNIDTSARLYYSPNVAAFRRTGKCSGFDVDLEGGYSFPVAAKQNPDQTEMASCILVAGANITQSHPILGLKIKKAVQNGAKLLVINPGETDLCHVAAKWISPYPGTELALIMGMCNVIVEEDLFDSAFTEMYCDNFADFRESLDDYSLGRVERITGVPRDVIEGSARTFAGRNPALIFWGSGITQYAHGTDNVHALMNLSIITGNIRHPNGLNPLAEQSNTLGACDMGCLPDYYPCYQPVGSADARERFESLWEVPLNPVAGLTMTEIMDATLAGKVKALYIIGSDPASAIAPSEKVHAALRKAKFIVLQDLFLNETAKYAHVIFPAASFAEKEGTFINTEGKAQSIAKALEPAGNSLPDWVILCELAKRLECKGFAFESADDILSEVLSVVQSLPERIGRFRLFPLQYTPPTETADTDYPVILTVERGPFSGGILSDKVEGLKKLMITPCVRISAKDAADFEISDGESIRVISRHGVIETEARVTRSTPAGLAVMSLDEKNINQLLNPALDVLSKTPEMKMCPVRLEKISNGRRLKKKREFVTTASGKSA